MSIAALKRRRKQLKVRNRHLAKIGRPGVPKAHTAGYYARKLQRLIEGERKRAHNKSAGKR